ncbi:MAG: hypothetical protein ACT4PE_13710 [Candidatus Eiseniibacteriota bacterium]
MSPGAKGPRPTFRELLVEGGAERCEGLLLGLILGSGSGARILFCEESGIATPLGERLLQFARLRAGGTHLVTDSEGHRLIHQHAKGLADAGLRIVEERKVVEGRFRYRFRAYARRYGQEIQELLESLPRELRHEPGKRHETVDPRATATEGYAPVHDYEIEGDGVVRGARIDLLVEARRALDDHPLVKAEPIELESA